MKSGVVSPELIAQLPVSPLRVAVLGYGSQGRAWAQNLTEAGHRVTVGLPDGSDSHKIAEVDGIKSASFTEAIEDAEAVCFLIPDIHQAEIYSEIQERIRVGAMLVFAHGFSLYFNRIVPREDLDVTLIAPMCPGNTLRESWLGGPPVFGLFAVAKDASDLARNKGLIIARDLGLTRTGLVETNLEEETVTDIFAEQAVLCGGVSALVREAFNALVRAGYSPEVSFLCCLFELKNTVALMQEKGIYGAFESISHCAAYGSLKNGALPLADDVSQRFKRQIEEIQSGDFARELERDINLGSPVYARRIGELEMHPIEIARRTLLDKLDKLSRDHDE